MVTSYEAGFLCVRNRSGPSVGSFTLQTGHDHPRKYRLSKLLADASTTSANQQARELQKLIGLKHHMAGLSGRPRPGLNPPRQGLISTDRKVCLVRLSDVICGFENDTVRMLLDLHQGDVLADCPMIWTPA